VAGGFLISIGPATDYADLESKAGSFITKDFIKNLKSKPAGEVYLSNAWAITFQSMNADQSEAIVRGSLQVAHRIIGDSRTADVNVDKVGFRAVLIIKQGLWLVDRLEFGATRLSEGDALLKVGQSAPDFTLASPSGKNKVTLSEFQGKKPVVLIFGSYT
jgi:hypothetical protein